jgi:uncharacterized protein (TIGR03083 family)
MTDLPYGAFTSAEYQAYIRAGAAELRAAVRTASQDAPVPTCPGWTLGDLVLHLGSVHEWAALIVASGATKPPDRPHPSVPAAEPLADWYDGRVRHLLDTLRDTDPDKACWTHQRDFRVSAYWSRRQAHELAAHLADADIALGRTPHYDAGLAADGIGEVLDVWLPLVARYMKRHPDLVAPLVLRCTDRSESWLLSPCPDAAPKITGPHLGGAPPPDAAQHDAAQPDALLGEDRPVAEITGSAADLLLALWKRVDLDQLTVEGDVAVARRFLASALTP